MRRAQALAAGYGRKNDGKNAREAGGGAKRKRRECKTCGGLPYSLPAMRQASRSGKAPKGQRILLRPPPKKRQGRIRGHAEAAGQKKRASCRTPAFRFDLSAPAAPREQNAVCIRRQPLRRKGSPARPPGAEKRQNQPPGPCRSRISRHWRSFWRAACPWPRFPDDRPARLRRRRTGFRSAPRPSYRSGSQRADPPGHGLPAGRPAQR